MDVASNQLEEDTECGKYIYSDEYLDFFIRYDNDLEGVRRVMNPICIDVVNSRFLVAYKKAPTPDKPEEFFAYGYNNIPKLYGLMDVPAVEDIGGFAVRNLPGLKLTGKDVLVGFVDTGIDFRNPVFNDSRGNSRIEYIWDQNIESYGVGSPVFGYGGEYSKADIIAANVLDNPYSVIPIRDEVGHGTFMASVACGNEQLEENFSGVAPDSSIIMVKLRRAPQVLKDFYYVEEENCYSETDIAQAIRYLVNKAVQLKRPMVICLGVGTNQGGHDGGSNLEQYIQALSGLRGICFVAPAGNELGARAHYSGAVGEKEEAFSVGEVVEINVDAEVLGFVTELWGSAPGLLKVIIESPTGERLDTIISNDTGSTTGEFLFEGSRVFVQNVVIEQVSGDQLYFFRFTKPGPGIWRIIVMEALNQLGAGFNMWLPLGEFGGGRIKFIKPSPDITVTAPGSSYGCITAAAYNNINDAIYVESSRGFTRKGFVKPDITAPGVGIKGAFATSKEGTLYITRSGSSVATAILGGGVALILQWGIVEGNNLGINTEIIKQMLVRGAGRKEEEIYPNNIWGWGSLDLLQTFQNMRQ